MTAVLPPPSASTFPVSAGRLDVALTTPTPVSRHGTLSINTLSIFSPGHHSLLPCASRALGFSAPYPYPQGVFQRDCRWRCYGKPANILVLSDEMVHFSNHPGVWRRITAKSPESDEIHVILPPNTVCNSSAGYAITSLAQPATNKP